MHLFNWYHKVWLARRRQRQLAAANLTETALTAFYRQWPTALRRDISEVQLISVDLETTGLDPARDQMLSIGWVCLDHRRIYLSTARERLVRISGSVGQSACFHQITDRELAAALAPETALEEMLQAGSGRIWLFHHAGLDTAFLDRACRTHYGMPLTLPGIDTLALEHRRHRHGPPPALRLHQCRARYGLPEYPGHRALTDALATAELWLAWRARQPARLPLSHCLA